MFDRFLQRWSLTPDGEPVVTPTSHLLPVRFDNQRAMLKVSVVEEEKVGARLMLWWDGQGAAPVLAYDDDAILLERALDRPSLASMVHDGNDEQASLIICNIVAALHVSRPGPLPDLAPLDRWFEALEPAAGTQGGVLQLSALLAEKLLKEQKDIVPLHGDIHHGNILNFGSRGWLAIDPKGLIGDRAFDYANLFCNPDAGAATRPGRLAGQLILVAGAAGLEPKRLLEWVVAWAGLSAAFFLQDGLLPDTAIRIAELAAAEFDR
jgi:streptomycin 6-kinase